MNGYVAGKRSRQNKHESLFTVSRYRFTASYLERLMSSTWEADVPGSPHKLLNAYVHAHTNFTPLEADDALLHAEPDIRALRIGGFVWEKIDQGSQSLRPGYTYKSILGQNRICYRISQSPFKYI
jgi:hypothetical protein